MMEPGVTRVTYHDQVEVIFLSSTREQLRRMTG
jgi:hypothetical protein